MNYRFACMTEMTKIEILSRSLQLLILLYFYLEIISTVYARKPRLVSRLVLPVIWSFLSTTNSGVSTSGRANLQQAMSRICKTLYQCLGKELIVEAENKGVRAAQRLEIILQS